MCLAISSSDPGLMFTWTKRRQTVELGGFATHWWVGPGLRRNRELPEQPATRLSVGVSELYQNRIYSIDRGYWVSDKQIPQVVKGPENQNEGMYWLERRKVLRRRPLYPTELRPRTSRSNRSDCSRAPSF
jgi:hypothetical protein